MSTAITYKELQRWIKSKASTEKGAWALLMNQEEVLHLAHERCAKYAATLSESTTMVPTHKVVDAHDFKRVLVHLFAISTLWIHFKNADQWVNSVDFGNFQLSLEEFKLACTTITGSYSHEVLSDEQIEQDFKRLDTNNNGSVDFMEVNPPTPSLGIA